MNPMLLYFLIAMNPFYGVTSGVEGMAYIPQKQEVMVTIKPQVIMPSHELDSIIQKYFGSAWKDAKAVANCESHLNPLAENKKTQSIGLFQIRIAGKLANGRPSRETLLKAEPNIQFASQIFKSHGTFRKAWVACSRKVGSR